MVKEFNSLEEIEKYYDAESNTYVFKEDNEMIDLVVFNFDLNIGANIIAREIRALNIISFDIDAWDIRARDIDAWNIRANDIITWDIRARDINAWNITAWDVNAWDVNAWDIRALDIETRDINARNIYSKNISYYAVCFAYYNIKCISIKGRRENAKHFVLDGTLEVEENVD